ncbi:MAG: hypothetical protein JW786_05910 [Desulfobacterales bacterium]|nr:hypothetical protein [Desulfobacterales bacterium]
MLYLKHFLIIIFFLFLTGLIEPASFNRLDLINCMPVHGHMLNSGPYRNKRIPNSPSFYFEHKAPLRETNGQVSQVFSLIFKDNDPDLMDVYFTEDRNPTIYKSSIKDGKVIIRAHRPTVFQLWAVARKGENTFIAHTNCMLFGNSKTKAERIIFFPKTPEAPYIEMQASKQPYWPQTGQEFIFRISSKTGFVRFALPTDLMVLSNNKVFALKSYDRLRYVYTPAHDQYLRKAGVRAGRNDILFTQLREADHCFNLTHTLYVHRSRTAFENYAIGAAVFGASCFFFIGWIILNRKRRTPW